MVEGLPRSLLLEALEMKNHEIDRARKMPTEVTFAKKDEYGRTSGLPKLLDCTYRSDVNRIKITKNEELVLQAFFIRSTHVASGAERTTRILGSTVWEWTAELHADYPMLLRSLCNKFPDVYHSMKKRPIHTKDGIKMGYTNFDANVLAAVAQAEMPGFDEAAERARREAQWKKEYLRYLCVKRGIQEKLTKEKLSKRTTKCTARAASRVDGTFNAEKYEVIGVNMQTLQEFLRLTKQRYTQYTVPHECPLCLEGDTNRACFQDLQDQKSKAEDAKEEWPQDKEQQLKIVRGKTKSTTCIRNSLKSGGKG
jgi:hypothetical protein